MKDELYRIHCYAASLQQLCSQGDAQIQSVYLEGIFADIAQVTIDAYNNTSAEQNTTEFVDHFDLPTDNTLKIKRPPPMPAAPQK